MSNCPLIPNMKNSTILLLCILTITSTLFPTNNAYSRRISKEEIGIKDEQQQTKLTFYYHDTLTGSNPTTLQIAKTSGSTNSPSTFGSLSMTDSPLTETSDASSKLVGRAQGLYAMADQNEFANINIINLFFSEGDFNGSTLSVLGRNPVNNGGVVNELPVVGGTGSFRFAKGYIQAKTQSLDEKTGDSVVMYTVFVSHVGSSNGNDTTTVDAGGSPSGSSPATDGGSSTSSPNASHASLSSLVSFAVFFLPFLYFCVV